MTVVPDCRICDAPVSVRHYYLDGRVQNFPCRHWPDEYNEPRLEAEVCSTEGSGHAKEA